MIRRSICVPVAGATALGRNLTPFPKPSDHAELIQRGIYAKIRHLAEFIRDALE
ncbi:MAG: hypothetical protein WCS31_08085 [Verrucomicrobiae bacterium]